MRKSRRNSVRAENPYFPPKHQKRSPKQKRKEEKRIKELKADLSRAYKKSSVPKKRPRQRRSQAQTSSVKDMQERYKNVVREARDIKKDCMQQVANEKKNRLEVQRQLCIEKNALKREKEARSRAEAEVYQLREAKKVLERKISELLGRSRENMKSPKTAKHRRKSLKIPKRNRNVKKNGMKEKKSSMRTIASHSRASRSSSFPSIDRKKKTKRFSSTKKTETPKGNANKIRKSTVAAGDRNSGLAKRAGGKLKNSPYLASQKTNKRKSTGNLSSAGAA
eukprot:jgi/Bigna1/135361/aug1.29_g10069